MYKIVSAICYGAILFGSIGIIFITILEKYITIVCNLAVHLAVANGYAILTVY